MTLTQWDIALAALDPIQGSEQAGQRPVLVVSRESIHRALTIVTVLPMTSMKPGRKIYPTEVLLAKGTGGLPRDSVVLAHQIRTIARSRLRQRFGALQDPNLRQRVQAAMRLYLDLE